MYNSDLQTDVVMKKRYSALVYLTGTLHHKIKIIVFFLFVFFTYNQAGGGLHLLMEKTILMINNAAHPLTGQDY